MKGYGPESYGDAMADIYDAWYGIEGTAETVECLTTMLGTSASLLELGSGTGRLALPLAASGLNVTVIEASRKMLDVMAARVGGDRIKSHQMDMTDFAFPGLQFDLVLCAYHTFFQLSSRDAQVACLKCVARHLKPDGCAIVEAFVADSERPVDGVEVWRVDADSVALSVSKFDPATGAVDGQAIEISEGGIRLRPWRVLYLSPTELDEMASAAGLRLLDRWGGWDRSGFTDASTRHVSIYGLSSDMGTLPGPSL